MGNKALGFTVEQENTIWEMWRRGESLSATGRVLGESVPQIGRFLRKSGGIRPLPRRRRASHLTAGEREEISRGLLRQYLRKNADLRTFRDSPRQREDQVLGSSTVG